MSAMTTATATRPRSREALPHPGASTSRSSGRAGLPRGHLRTDRGPGGAARAASPAARRRGAATPRRLERDRRHGALALLAAVVVLGLLNGRGVAGALDPTADAAPAGAAAAAAPAGAVPADAAAPAGADHLPRPAYVVVAEGDTLWDLVGPHAPQGTDPAVYVARVATEADLDPRGLEPGTVVHLP